jgi:hypothetical protein
MLCPPLSARSLTKYRGGRMIAAVEEQYGE